jgi:hypothetical protein
LGQRQSEISGIFSGKQGDQIGQILAHWTIVCFWQLLENYTCKYVKFWAYFPTEKVMHSF